MEVKKCLFILSYLESIEKNSSVSRIGIFISEWKCKIYKFELNWNFTQAGQDCIVMYRVYSSEII